MNFLNIPYTILEMNFVTVPWYIVNFRSEKSNYRNHRILPNLYFSTLPLIL